MQTDIPLVAKARRISVNLEDDDLKAIDQAIDDYILACKLSRSPDARSAERWEARARTARTKLKLLVLGEDT